MPTPPSELGESTPEGGFAAPGGDASPRDRRRFLQLLGGLTAATLGSRWLVGASGCANRGSPVDPMPAGIGTTSAFAPDLDLSLKAVRTRAQLLPGTASEIWTLRGSVSSGPASSLVEHPSQGLGPTLHVRRGQKLRVVVQNDLDEPTVIHWHGLTVPEKMDGHPRFAIAPGQHYVHEFEIRNRAGTYWYHAHPDTRTGPQVYRGMAGLLIVHDEEEDALPLPRGDFDVPLVVQDRVFDADNQLIYAPTMMDAMTGWRGDRVLVNGTADYTLRAQTRAYRFRILNGSNSRIYRLAWSDGSPLTVIGTDGGLLSQPVTRQYVLLAPAERVELWADFRERPLGSELRLVSLAFDAGGAPGPMSAGVPQGAALTILTVKVAERSAERLALPRKLTPLSFRREADALNRDKPRRVVPTMRHMSWSLNSRSFRMQEVAPDERVKLGTLEIWEFDNTVQGGSRGGGRGMGMMGMAMPHPMHLHAGQFQILSRQGVSHSGYVDEGWKDTVLVMPGERARILMRYTDFPGLYLYHCHNLEHEDRGMMRNFYIEA